LGGATTIGGPLNVGGVITATGGFRLSNSSYNSTLMQYSISDAIGIMNPTGTSFANANSVLSLGAMANGSSLTSTGNGYFNGSITSGGAIIAGTTVSSTGYMYGAGYNINSMSTPGGMWGSGSTMYIADWATGGKGLNINTVTGNVIFSGNATAASLTTGTLETYITPSTGFAQHMYLKGTGNYNSFQLGIKGAYDGFMATTGCDLHIMSGKDVASENHAIYFYTGHIGTGGEAQNNLKLTIAANGIATFANNVVTNGNIIAYGTIQFYTASDRRLKTDFETIFNPIEKIKSLTGYFFNYTDQAMQLGGYTSRRDIGLIAQDVHAILPEATGKLWNSDFMGYKADKLIPLLVEAIKQQQTEIDQLKRQIAA